MTYDLFCSEAAIYNRRQHLLKNRFGFPNPFRTEAQILSDRIMELLFHTTGEDLRAWQMDLHSRYFQGVPENDFASMTFFEALIGCLESVSDLSGYEEGLLDGLYQMRSQPSSVSGDTCFPAYALYYFVDCDTYADGLMVGQLIGEMLYRLQFCLQS